MYICVYVYQLCTCATRARMRVYIRARVNLRSNLDRSATRKIRREENNEFELIPTDRTRNEEERHSI
jgi:hypothetical protein